MMVPMTYRQSQTISTLKVAISDIYSKGQTTLGSITENGSIKALKGGRSMNLGWPLEKGDGKF